MLGDLIDKGVTASTAAVALPFLMTSFALALLGGALGVTPRARREWRFGFVYGAGHGGEGLDEYRMGMGMRHACGETRVGT